MKFKEIVNFYSIYLIRFILRRSVPPYLKTHRERLLMDFSISFQEKWKFLLNKLEWNIDLNSAQ